MTETKWKTKFTETFCTRLPIMGAPMAECSGGLLAAETSRAGALGFIGAGHNESEEELAKEVEIFRNAYPSNNNNDNNDAPQLCLGFIGHSNFRDASTVARFRRVMEQHKPQVVQFFAPSLVHLDGNNTIADQQQQQHQTKTNIDICHHEFQTKVLCQVGSVKDARAALAAGADGIIVQGIEAGGHGLRNDVGNGTLSLASRVVSIVKEDDTKKDTVPVLAAGGIVDGRGLMAALALGCDGVCLGTRLWASKEALGDDTSKQVLASPDTEPDSCIRTTVIDQIANSYRAKPWPYPYDSSGIVRNTLSNQWDGKESELDAVIDEVAARYKKASQEGDLSIAQVYSGQGVGDICSIDPAYDILTKIDKEARDILKSLPKLLE